MRSRHITLMAEGATAPARRSRYVELLTLFALLIVAGWIAYAFAQQAYADHRLAEEEAGLRRQNAQLQSQNDQYRKDVAAVQSGADAEENARHEGYARPGEKVYVVSQAAAPTPPPKAVVRVDTGSNDLLAAVSTWVGERLHRR